MGEDLLESATKKKTSKRRDRSRQRVRSRRLRRRKARVSTTRREFLQIGGGALAASMLPLQLPARAGAQALPPGGGGSEGELPKAAALTSSTNTYQEYQPVVNLPVNPVEPHLKIVRRPDGGQELMTLSRLSPTGLHEVSHFSPDPESYSGWRQTILPVDGRFSNRPITQFEAFVEGDELFTLFKFDIDTEPIGAALIFFRDGNFLRRAPLPAEIELLISRVLRIAVVPLAGRTIIYGVSNGPGSLTNFGISYRDGRWDLLYQDTFRVSTATMDVLLPGQDGNDLRRLVSLRLNQRNNFYWQNNGNIVGGRVEWTGFQECPRLTIAALFESAEFMPGGAPRDELLLRGDANVLWHLKGPCSLEPELERLTGMPGGPASLTNVSVGSLGPGQGAVIFGQEGVLGPIWIKLPSTLRS